MEIVPAVLVAHAAAASFFYGLSGAGLLTASAVLTIAVLLAFPLYFRSANESFASASIANEDVAAELRRWSRWHWSRTGVAVLAFVAALLALAQR